MNHPQFPAARTYLMVWISLLILLALTLGSAFISLGNGNVVVNLVIAAIKAYLVGIFFMHLTTGSVMSRLVISAGVLWLMVLIGLMLTDYLTRT